jgi:hypothetical protein
MAINPNDKDFLKSQFDKIYVGVFLVLSGWFLLHVMHHQSDSSNVNQAWGLMTFFMGLLSGLITGRHIGRDEPENTKSIVIKETPAIAEPPQPAAEGKL